MKKKNIKVKKGNGDISITIENNLNANNKQINHQSIKRKRRKKKVENNDETLQQSLQELPPLKDVSYIKPGPIGNFKVWRDTMDSYNTTVPMNQAQQLGLVPPRLPAPEPTSALPAPEQQQMLTFDNWQRAMTMMREQQQPLREQQQPPVSWGRELIDDDDEPIMPASPVFSTMSRANDLEDYDDFAKDFEDSVAEVYRLENNDPDLKSAGKEVQKILNLAQARRLGTIHGKKKLLPENIRQTEFYNKIKDTTAYKTAYEKAFNTIRQPPQNFSEIQEEGPPRTLRTRSVRMSENVTNRSRDRERERMQREIEQLNQQMPDFGDFENFDVDTELARAGLTRIVEF